MQGPALMIFYAETLAFYLISLGSFSCCNSLDAGIQTAFVAARGVLVEDALLHALIQNGRGLAVLSGGCGVVALGDGLAKLAQGAAQLALIRAVYRGFDYGLTCALQR